MTDQYFDITVDQNNNLVSADGPAFGVMPAVNYPLQSPAAGVEVLEAQQQAYFAQNASVGQPSAGSVDDTTHGDEFVGYDPAESPVNLTRVTPRPRHRPARRSSTSRWTPRRSRTRPIN